MPSPLSTTHSVQAVAQKEDVPHRTIATQGNAKQRVLTPFADKDRENFRAHASEADRNLAHKMAESIRNNPKTPVSLDNNDRVNDLRIPKTSNYILKEEEARTQSNLQNVDNAPWP